MTTLARTLATPAPARRHYPIGASTGYMSELRGRWHDQLDLACAISPFAVELSALAEPELESLLEFLSGARALPFRYVSVHGPSKDRRMSEAELVDSLARLPALVDAVVMHPDTIEEPALYEVLGPRLVIENMDPRKPTGRTVDELAPLFDRLPEVGFCFDIAHAHSIDHSMAVANELLDAFGPRLRHVHLSSLSDDLCHVPLLPEDEEVFLPLLSRCLDVPWILEAFHQPT